MGGQWAVNGRPFDDPRRLQWALIERPSRRVDGLMGIEWVLSETGLMGGQWAPIR